MLHRSSREQPGAARSSEKQYTKLVSALEVSPRAPLQLHPMKVYNEVNQSAAAKRGGAAKVGQEDASSQDFRSNSHGFTHLPSSLTNTQQQPADISDERQPFP
ncbi:hypothetical protein QJQ45_013705 [Haematococcus lacustris]|nr:hypothetical protein QJQ45_013705 [Haematococcus lacustris]